MAIQSNFPSLKPTLLLDFANTKQLDPRITFTRASTATFYDGVTTAMAEQNLLVQSQDFETASWTKSQTAISGTNTIVAPDGTTTAEEVRDGAATNIHSCFQSVTLASGTTYVASVFLKNVDRQYAILAVSGGVAAYASAKFDLTGGTSTASQAAGAGWSVTSATITSVGSGWYRCVLVFVSGTGGSCNFRVGTASDGTTFTTNGSGLESYTGTDLKIAVWGAQLEQRSSVTAYTATTTAPITNYIPALRTAAAGVARFEHNPVTGESLGLEIEEQRTNAILQSETFSTTWTATRSSITDNTVVSPAGTLTADVLIGNTENNIHFISQNPTTTATSTTFSIYAKAAGRNFVALQISDSSNTGRVTYFNLSTGVVGTTGTGITASMVSVGNGWYRCVATVATAYAGSNTCVVAIADVDGSLTYTGDGYSGIYIWGAQLEAGAFATSYIPTVASQVTRSADAASMTGTNFSSWYRADEGTFYAEFAPASSNFGSNKNIFVASDGTTNNYNGLRYTSSGSQTAATAAVAGIVQSNIVSGTMVAGTWYKMVGAYKVNDFAMSRDAGTVGTDTSGTLPVVTQAEIGALAGTNISSQMIKKLAYYQLRVTNAQLQAMTTV